MPGLQISNVIQIVLFTLFISISESQKNRRMTALFHMQKLWPFSSSIPYYINTSYIPVSYRADIVQAITQIQSNKAFCLKFQQLTSMPSSGSFIHFINGTGCNADVGYKAGSPTVVQLDPLNCPIGAIIHEVGHTLGLLHTMQRPDASQNIYIDTTTLQSAALAQYQYGDYLAEGIVATPYDYSSIMHYSRTAGAKAQDQITMYAPRAIGQLRGYSDFDIAELDWMYGSCKTNTPRCLCTAPPTVNVGVGQTISILFYGNMNPDDTATKQLRVFYEIPVNATANATNGEYYSIPKPPIEVKFTPSLAQAIQSTTYRIRVTFEYMSAASASCTVDVNIVYYPIPKVECFGFDASASTVCSGHGQCLITDTCKCTSGFEGTMCNQTVRAPDIGYEFLPSSPLDFSPQYSATPSTGRRIDWQLNIGEGGEFELFEITFAFFTLTAATVQYTFFDSTNTPFITKTNSHPAIAILPVTPQYIIYKSEFGVIPKNGYIILNTTAQTALANSPTTQKAYVRFGGIMRCQDGWYGPRCTDKCMGGVGALQCNRRGRCYDGTSGSGKCRCLVPNFRAVDGCAVCERGWRGTNCEIKYTPTSTPTPTQRSTKTNTPTPTRTRPRTLTPTPIPPKPSPSPKAPSINSTSVTPSGTIITLPSLNLILITLAISIMMQLLAA